MTPAGRSLLFVPANRPDRYGKALASGADLVCIDLEDAVAPGPAKDLARQCVRDEWRRFAPGAPGGARLLLRINRPGTPEGRADLRMLLDQPGPWPALVLPKVGSAAELAGIDALLARPGAEPARLLPMIETAAGLEAAAEIARCLPAARLLGLFLGGVDLAAELGCAPAWEPLLYARSRVVHAAALAGIGAIDTPSLEIGQADALEAEARRSAQLGFAGKAAIHPEQIAPIHRGFAPSAAEADRARRTVAAYEQMGGGVALLDGRLIERPVYVAAQRILRRLP